MWTSLNDYDGPGVIDVDLCIVGAGAAGITLARALRGTKLQIALLESGGFEFDVASHHLYYADLHADLCADTEQFPILVMHRLRYFGGSTNHWGGRCRRLDPEDLQERSWVPDSGWPIQYAELARHYPAAEEVCQVRSFDYEPADVMAADLPPVDLAGSPDLDTRVFHYSPPTRFGTRYRKEITEADNIQVFLHANVTEFVPVDSLAAIERVRVVSLEGKRLEVRARAFVLATGGIENARLLLNSDRHAPGGIGNGHGLVGKYFMDHPHLRVGDVIFTDPQLNLDLYRHRSVSRSLKQKVHGVFTSTRAFQEREETLAFSAQISHPVRSIDRQPPLIRSLARAAVGLDSALGEHPDAVPGAPRVYQLHARCEQAPSRSSRVELTSDTDRLGMRKVEVYWQLSELDRRTWIRSVEMLGRELARLFLGRARTLVREDEWPQGDMGAHHCGTTRMHDDPKRGVVDRECRVHGVANLYVAGSSVFPTVGFANPTLTLVALSLRLADHLATELG